MITIKSTDGISDNIEILDENGNNLLAALDVVTLDIQFRTGTPIVAFMQVNFTNVDVVVDGNITVNPKE